MRCPRCESKINYVINEDHLSGEPKKKIIHRPLKNSDGSLNWGNLFYMPIENIIMIAAILFLLFGINEINQQCYEILEDPCEVIDKYECTGVYAESSEFIFEENETLRIPEIQIPE